MKKQDWEIYTVALIIFLAVAFAAVPQVNFKPRIVAASTEASAIPQSRVLTNWANAGVGGRFGWSRPEFIWTNVANISTTGATNVAAAIQAIINAAPVNAASNLVIYFPPGTYSLSNELSMRGFVTLRGSKTNSAGVVTPYPTNTIFSAQHSANSVIDYTAGYSFQPKISILGGSISAGATNLTFSSVPTGVEPNSIIYITQTNSLASGVTSDGWESATVAPCNYCSIETTDYIWSQAQAIEVLTVSNGTNITFRPPAYATLTNNASVYYNPAWDFSPFVGIGYNNLAYGGLENLHVRITNGYAPVHGIQMDKTSDCWIRGVTLSGPADKALIKTIHTTRLTFTNNCVLNNPGVGAASGGGMVLFPGTMDSLFSDNIAVACREPISINGPAAGNVISYNYITNTPNVNSNFVVAGINFHGAFPFFNLIEGNYGYKFHADIIHGSAAWNAVVGNFITGRHPTTGGITNDSGQGAIWIDSTNWYFTVAGNILGYSGIGSDIANYTNEVRSPTVESDGDAFNNVVVGAKGPVWVERYGYSGFLTNRGWDQTIIDTLLRANNYSYYTNAMLHATNAVVPNSLYLNSAPAFFGSLNFPPYNGRQAQNFTFASAAVAIPAGYRWNNNGANP